MMRKCLTLILLIVCIFNLASCTTSNENEDDDKVYDFQHSNWGMTREEVIKQEDSLELTDFENLLISNTTSILSEDAKLIFAFENDKLINGMILFDIEHTNENLYIDDYDRVKEALIEKYGTTTDEKQVWKDDLYKDDPDDWGFAISLGDLFYMSTWEISDSYVNLLLQGDNYSISMSILYRSKSDEMTTDLSGI